MTNDNTEDSRDRLFGTVVTAEWTWKNTSQDFGGTWHGVRETLLASFAATTAWASSTRSMRWVRRCCGGSKRLTRSGYYAEPACLSVDLTPFGMENRNEVFLPIDEPSGAD